MFSKKADGGLSMGFIVILAISLVVMIIVIGIFVARSRDGDMGLRSCEARNGVCVLGATSCTGNHNNYPLASNIPIFGAICYDGNNNARDPNTYVCCMRKPPEESSAQQVAQT